MNTDKLKELLAAATPGPWHFADCSVESCEIVSGVERVMCDGLTGGDIEKPVRTADIELIVAAVNALPSLLARLEAAEKVVEAVRSVAAERVSAAESGDCFNDGWAYDFLDAALTTYDQENARG